MQKLYVPRSRLMAMKLFVGLLMTTAMGLSIGGVFWMKDFDKQSLNTTPQTTSLKIKVPHGPRLDIWGSWLCVWAFHLILLSLTIQIDTGHKYRVIRWGFYLDLAVLVFTVLSTLISGGFLLGFRKLECNEDIAAEVVNKFEKHPNKNITRAGSDYKFSIDEAANNTIKLRDRDTVIKVIIDDCRSNINLEIIFAAGALEFSSSCLIFLMMGLAFCVKKEMAKEDVVHEPEGNVGRKMEQKEIQQKKSKGSGYLHHPDVPPDEAQPNDPTDFTEGTVLKQTQSLPVDGSSDGPRPAILTSPSVPFHLKSQP